MQFSVIERSMTSTHRRECLADKYGRFANRH
jgi:hypothetical protein